MIKKFSEKKKFSPLKDPQDYLNGNSLIENFLLCCDCFRNRTACQDSILGYLSYKDLKRKVVALALYFEKFPDKYIGIMLPSSAIVYVCIFAVMLANKVPVMVNWTFSRKDINAIKKSLSYSKVITSKSFLSTLKSSSEEENSFMYLEDWVASLSLKDRLKFWLKSIGSCKRILKKFSCFTGKKDTAVILFTSGTEKVPKIVPLTHENILSNQKGCLEDIKLNLDDILMSILPPFHSFGFTITGTLPLITGRAVVYYPNPLDNKSIIRFIKKTQATLLFTTPTFFHYMIGNVSDSSLLSSLRLVVLGGEKASERILKEFKNINPNTQLLQGYGITECSPVIAVPYKENTPFSSVGQVLSNTSILIIDKDNRSPVIQGNIGLILVNGPGVFTSYFNQENHEEEVFFVYNKQNWYITGDLGYLDKNDNLFIQGRLKRFVKIGGEMISLSAIENTFNEEFSEKDLKKPLFAVVSLENLGAKPKLFLFSVFEMSLKEANHVLKRKGERSLAKLSSVIKIDEIPLLVTGKPNYRALEDIVRNDLD